jgi:hypothetical protein
MQKLIMTLNKSLKLSLVLTLPISVFFLIWMLETSSRFFDFGIRYDAAPYKVGLHKVGVYEFGKILRGLEIALNPYNNSELDNIDLYVPKSSFKELDSNLPYSGKKYVKGVMQTDKGLKKIKLRYRGDHIWHWGRHKKSMRVKTNKKNMYLGMKKFNLIAPKQDHMLGTVLGYKLAELFELITPKSKLVNVNINGKRKGVHVLVEQIEELTLRNNSKIPGDIFSGDLISTDKVKGVSNNVFNHPGLWKKIAINNHYNKEQFASLSKLTRLINAPASNEVHSNLSEILDMEYWGRFAAFETLAQTFHFDNTHNWKLYYDPALSKFIPIVWDPMAWNENWRPNNNNKGLIDLDIIASKFHLRLIQNGDFLRARHAAIMNFFGSGLDKVFLKEVEHLIKTMRGSLYMDPGLGLLTNRKGDSMQNPRNAVLLQHKLLKNIKDVFHQVMIGYLYGEQSVEYSVNGEVVAFEYSGRAPLKKIEIKFLNGNAKQYEFDLSFYSNGEKIKNNINNLAGVNLNLISDFSIENGDREYKQGLVKLRPMYYELSVKNIIMGDKITEILFFDSEDKLINSIHKKIIKKNDNVKIFRAFPYREKTKDIVWKGNINIDKVLTIKGGLKILPGTVINLASGASLIIEGRLTAIGTKNNKIIFKSGYKSDDPWGAIVLRNSLANGSRVKFCEFDGGSGLKSDYYEYSGMLSIHNVRDVIIDNSKFSNSKIVDDMVHSVYSDLYINNSEFYNAKSDALDIDMGTVVIKNSLFKNSGNDAIDLMDSEAVVVNSIIINNKDKGVSVGEDSMLLSIDNLLSQNLIGVQTKDSSVSYLFNNDFVRNDTAVYAYWKNWRYGKGGLSLVSNSKFENNNKLMYIGKRSNIEIHDSLIDNKAALELNSNEKIIFNNADLNKRFSSVNTSPSFPERNFNNKSLTYWWTTIRNSGRGRRIEE